MICKIGQRVDLQVQCFNWCVLGYRMTMLILAPIVKSTIVNGVFMLCGNTWSVELIDCQQMISSLTIGACTIVVDARGASTNFTIHIGASWGRQLGGWLKGPLTFNKFNKVLKVWARSWCYQCYFVTQLNVSLAFASSWKHASTNNCGLKRAHT
jgi:hypothetical protein